MMMTIAINRSDSESKDAAEQDKIFIEMPIPRTLAEIGFLQAEKDIKEGKEGQGSALYGIVTGLKGDMSGASQVPNLLQKGTGQKYRNFLFFFSNFSPFFRFRHIFQMFVIFHFVFKILS